MQLICDKGYSNTLANLVNKIDDDSIEQLYTCVAVACKHNSGRFPEFTLSNLSDIGPRLIPCNKYQDYKRRLAHCQKEPTELLEYMEPAQYRAYINERDKRLEAAYNDVWNIVNLCGGFNYSVDDWLNKYRDDLATKKCQLDFTKSYKSEVMKFKSFLLDCASYVDFYYSKVTNKAFCNDVFEYYQGLLPESQLPKELPYGSFIVFREFVLRLIMCASMLYKLSNDTIPCEYDGEFEVNYYMVFRLKAGQHPKGLYRTKTALKVFEVISLLWS